MSLRFLTFQPYLTTEKRAVVEILLFFLELVLKNIYHFRYDANSVWQILNLSWIFVEIEDFENKSFLCKYIIFEGPMWVRVKIPIPKIISFVLSEINHLRFAVILFPNLNRSTSKPGLIKSKRVNVVGDIYVHVHLLLVEMWHSNLWPFTELDKTRKFP